MPEAHLELISDVLLWTPSHGRAKAGLPARTYIQQHCEDMGCSPDDLPESMNNRVDGERGSGISVLMARQNDDDDDDEAPLKWNNERIKDLFLKRLSSNLNLKAIC